MSDAIDRTTVVVFSVLVLLLLALAWCGCVTTRTEECAWQRTVVVPAVSGTRQASNVRPSEIEQGWKQCTVVEDKNGEVE